VRYRLLPFAQVWWMPFGKKVRGCATVRCPAAKFTCGTAVRKWEVRVLCNARQTSMGQDHTAQMCVGEGVYDAECASPSMRDPPKASIS
jgi:hypothetical protein